ncbi:hypothetical protein GE21DRAFT_7862 [Neurospora crassa]|uniref:Mid2 domain-containing protein n=2 Tax=Neurospora crassa TaxID=5141 RepID=Q1K6L5_NEUCR|nr:hypothetical protein NCU01426 [Neurospora crassa OR74A]EAA31458.2 hypothetical protein NCU01426 [Neurospora crassa OR74A]KHE86898.1 hypothetical protein GE21DRAFT_7862 [Neurospora crassa]|eukprot:XP_960694.2 hypothetical protein NCU01426 [Neurospora crassa OR74A]
MMEASIQLHVLAMLVWLIPAIVTVAAYENFQAVETGVLLSPRYFQEYAASNASPLEKRQGQLQCPNDQHSCLEIGNDGGSFCCGNDQFCQANPTALTKAACCAIGSNCGSPCTSDMTLCAATRTITTGDNPSVTLLSACCARQCSVSFYLCPKSLGGSCCPYGQACAEGGKCIATITPSSSISTLVPLVPSGCTTSQTSCDASIGGGCCDLTQSCTQITGKAFCAERAAFPTISGIAEFHPDHDLSAGAKAGIAIGVVVGFGLLIGVLTWWCLQSRRRRRASEAGGTVPSFSHRSGPSRIIGAIIGGGGREQQPMSEVTSDVQSRSGGTQDYFGPEAAVGPYSDSRLPSTGTTPGIDRDRGVPLQPHGPGDIAVPVEIDSRMMTEQENQGIGATASPTTHQASETGQPAGNQEEDGDRYELYGSEPLDMEGGSVSPLYTPSPHTQTMRTPSQEAPRPVKLL